MGNMFMPGGVTDRLITLKASAAEPIPQPAGGTVNILVLNQTGKTIQLLAFNAICSSANANATADVRNAGGSMLSATAAIGTAPGTAAAGTLHATNLTVLSGGTVTFRFVQDAGGGNPVNDAQATALFTVIA